MPLRHDIIFLFYVKQVQKLQKFLLSIYIALLAGREMKRCPENFGFAEQLELLTGLRGEEEQKPL